MELDEIQKIPEGRRVFKGLDTGSSPHITPICRPVASKPVKLSTSRRVGEDLFIIAEGQVMLERASAWVPARGRCRWPSSGRQNPWGLVHAAE